jgi:hypothetical protein
MQYLLLLTYRPEDNTQEGTPEFEAEMRRWGELNEEMRQAGVAAAVEENAADRVVGGRVVSVEREHGTVALERRVDVTEVGRQGGQHAGVLERKRALGGPLLEPFELAARLLPLAVPL